MGGLYIGSILLSGTLSLNVLARAYEMSSIVDCQVHSEDLTSNLLHQLRVHPADGADHLSSSRRTMEVPLWKNQKRSKMLVSSTIEAQR